MESGFQSFTTEFAAKECRVTQLEEGARQIAVDVFEVCAELAEIQGKRNSQGRPPQEGRETMAGMQDTVSKVTAASVAIVEEAEAKVSAISPATGIAEAIAQASSELEDSPSRVSPSEFATPLAVSPQPLAVDDKPEADTGGIAVLPPLPAEFSKPESLPTVLGPTEQTALDAEMPPRHEAPPVEGDSIPAAPRREPPQTALPVEVHPRNAAPLMEAGSIPAAPTSEPPQVQPAHASALFESADSNLAAPTTELLQTAVLVETRVETQSRYKAPPPLKVGDTPAAPTREPPQVQPAQASPGFESVGSISAASVKEKSPSCKYKAPPAGIILPVASISTAPNSKPPPLGWSPTGLGRGSSGLAPPAKKAPPPAPPPQATPHQPTSPGDAGNSGSAASGMSKAATTKPPRKPPPAEKELARPRAPSVLDSSKNVVSGTPIGLTSNVF